jgi:NAD-dependent deacetylase
MNDKGGSPLSRAAKWLAGAREVACLTGAGISAESGVATFRGADGLWEGHRPEEVATPEAFETDPDLVCRFYHARRLRLVQCRPNPGHDALVALERRYPRFTLITQNVDDLHRAAGSRNLIELHGNIWIDRCSRCAVEERLSAAPEAPLRRCPACGGRLRPGVVWFGEMLPPGALEAAAAVVERCEVLLVVGTSSVVHPAASLAWHARKYGARVIEINPEATPLTAHADLVIAEKAGAALPALLTAIDRAGDSLVRVP